MLREHTVVTVLEVVWMICKERFPRISIPFFDGSHMICIVNLSWWNPSTIWESCNNNSIKMALLRAPRWLKPLQTRFPGWFEGSKFKKQWFAPSKFWSACWVVLQGYTEHRINTLADCAKVEKTKPETPVALGPCDGWCPCGSFGPCALLSPSCTMCSPPQPRPWFSAQLRGSASVQSRRGRSWPPRSKEPSQPRSCWPSWTRPRIARPSTRFTPRRRTPLWRPWRGGDGDDWRVHGIAVCYLDSRGGWGRWSAGISWVAGRVPTSFGQWCTCRKWIQCCRRVCYLLWWKSFPAKCVAWTPSTCPTACGHQRSSKKSSLQCSNWCPPFPRRYHQRPRTWSHKPFRTVSAQQPNSRMLQKKCWRCCRPS